MTDKEQRLADDKMRAEIAHLFELASLERKKTKWHEVTAMALPFIIAVVGAGVAITLATLN